MVGESSRCVGGGHEEEEEERFLMSGSSPPGTHFCLREEGEREQKVEEEEMRGERVDLHPFPGREEEDLVSVGSIIRHKLQRERGETDAAAGTASPLQPGEEEEEEELALSRCPCLDRPQPLSLHLLVNSPRCVHIHLFV